MNDEQTQEDGDRMRAERDAATRGGALTIVLVAAALICAVGGILYTSEITMGPSIIALGCLFAILARIAQAR